jgi:hypothetical protein
MYTLRALKNKGKLYLICRDKIKWKTKQNRRKSQNLYHWHKYMTTHLLSCLGTGTSIKSGRVKPHFCSFIDPFLLKWCSRASAFHMGEGCRIQTSEDFQENGRSWFKKNQLINKAKLYTVSSHKINKQYIYVFAINFVYMIEF